MKRSIFGGFLLLLYSALPLAVQSEGVLPSQAPPILIAPPVEDIQPVDGTVIPVDGGATVKLINKTNAKIRYQFLGKPGTRQTILEGQVESKLIKLPLPISLTFRRVDNGFLKVVLKSSKAALLEVELDENTDFDSDRISLWISPNGEVYLN
jgi:hypothetical protein